MVTYHDVPVQEFIIALAEEFKKMPEMSPPEWAAIVKTGTHKERPPVDKNWWYMRTAAVLRTVAIKGPIGVSKLRSKYGGKKNRGVRPSHTVKGSGSIARKILQQLQAAQLTKLDKKGVYKGRVITPAGLKLMNNIANSISKTDAPKPTKKEAPLEKAKKVEKKASSEKSKHKETTTAPSEKPVEASEAKENDGAGSDKEA